ncbi:MAG TPA: hypothetical protein GXZ47_02500 [Treponema sp.]|nr:hypothetical protein [Treponema sp.]
MKHPIFSTIVAAIALFSLVSCATVPDPESIPTDLSVAELSRRGQTELDNNNYKAAEVYYNLIVTRYGTDTAALTAAEFEIAHIRIKQEKYEDAASLLQNLIGRYETSGGAGLPPEYLALAKNDLEKIPKEYLSTEKED